MAPGGDTINKFVGDFIKTNVDNFMHIHKEDFTDILENKIKETERETQSYGRRNKTGSRTRKESKSAQ